jgi:hypothetical protein
VTRTARGGLILPKNVVEVRPNVRVLGLQGASTDTAARVAGIGVGTVQVRVVDADSVSEGHRFRIQFTAPPDSIRATQYTLTDSTAGRVCIEHGSDFSATGDGAVGCGLLPLVATIPNTRVWTDSTGFTPSSTTTTRLKAAYVAVQDINLRRSAFPADLRVEFDDVVRDTSTATALFLAKPAKFRVFAETSQGDVQLDFVFRDFDDNQNIGPRTSDRIDVLIPSPGVVTPDSLVTWSITLQTVGTLPHAGDVWRLRLQQPLGAADVFAFTTHASRIDPAAAKAQFETPYVVPNPYVEAASFEPARFNVSGRGERRLEFRAIPTGATIRIYTVRGDLVQTLRHDGSQGGFVAWNLRTKDNLEVAPGLFVYQVDAPGIGTSIGKFAIIK